MLGHANSTARTELTRIIRLARRRWRIRMLLRGTAVVLPAALAAVLVSSFGLERYAFAPSWIIAFRVLTYLVLAAAVIRFLIRPQLRRVSDERVALYLEEHEPSLEAALVSAVELADAGGPEDRPDRSPALVRRLVEQAVERTHAVDDGRRIDRVELRLATGGVATTAAAALVLFLVGPDFLRHGASAVLFPWRQAEAAMPYNIAVQPGDVTVARGSDQIVTARLHGFSTGDVDLLVRTATGGEFERIAMSAAADSGAFEAFLFDVGEAASYFVEAGGVRSQLFRIDVADLPYARRLDHEYRFPSYTGLPPRTVENATDIAVLKGTEVRFRVWTTVATPAGRILLDDGRTFDLAPAADGAPAPDAAAAPDAGSPGPEAAEGSQPDTPPPPAASTAAPLIGALPVDRPGHYRIELLGPDGEWVAGSPPHTIDIVADQPPSISFERPGRDTRASPIDEIFVEAHAVDDYGIGRLELVYAVNGGDEQTVDLFAAGARPLRDVSAGHTFYLEETELRPGDFVSYYARTADNNGIGARQEATSDIYFIRIQPFRKDYRAAEQAGGGMPGGSMGEDAELSEQQRSIIAATFNLIRDQKRYSDAEYGENVTTVALAQSRLREQVEALVNQMRSRGVVSADSAFATILELLERAAAEMKDAGERLDARETREALPPEQRALQQLQRAEEVYREVQVSLSQQSAGGGGGGASPNAEDLADLFELEMDKLRNQYEAVQRGQEQELDASLDETLERLKELARRQEQAAERQRRLSRQQQGATGGAGGAGQAQRQLAGEVEEEARRLERLARENPRQGGALEESARRLREAAEAIRRSAADPAGAGAGSAADRLAEARRLLERDRTDRLVRDAEDAQRRAERLAEEQRDITEDVRGLRRAGGADPDRMQRLMERKDQLAEGVATLERDLDRMAADATREELDAADRFRDAATTIREDKIKEKIQYSKGVVQSGDADYADAFEREITGDLDALRDRLADAARDVATAGEESGREDAALDRARRLARGMETLGERLGERLEEGRSRRGLQAPRNDASDAAGSAGGSDAQAGTNAPGGRPGDPTGARTGAPATSGARDGRPSPGGSPAGPAPLGGDEIRQFRRETRERIAEAEALRQELARQGRDVEALSRIIAAMRELDSQRVYADAAEIERLRTQIVEGLKRFEFGLRRELRGVDADRVFLPGAGEVPAGYEEWVAEYYRSLGRSGGGS